MNQTTEATQSSQEKVLRDAGWQFDEADYLWFLPGENEGLGFSLEEAVRMVQP